MTGPQFCGYAVPGDRGGPAEACGKALPCDSHPDDQLSHAEAAITSALKWLRLSDENMSRASSFTQVDRATLTLGEYLEQKKLREGGTL